MATVRITDIFDAKKETQIFAKVIFPFLVKGFSEGVETGSSQGSGQTTPEDVMDKEILKSIKKLSLATAASAVNTQEKQLKKLIKDVLKDDGTISDLTTAIKQTYNLDRRWKAQRIARTELTGVIGHGTLQGLIAEGYFECTWVTAIDGKERPTHAAVNGNTIVIGQNFGLNGTSSKYPGDPGLDISERANCRCTLVGAGLPQRMVERLTFRFLRTHGRIERVMISALIRAYGEQRDRIIAELSSN